MKILFRYLERTDNMRLRQRAKRVVAECTRRNRSGDLRYMPLREAVEDHLRVTVGNEFYSRVQNYCEYYCAKKGFNPTVAAV